MGSKYLTMEEYKELQELLKAAELLDAKIDMSEVILDLNERGIDYHNWTDVEMIIEYVDTKMKGLK